MKVLIIYAHHNRHSFCHAVLERFCAGLREAGHEHQVVDLHAIGFNPILTDRDAPNWIDDSIPDDVLDHMVVRETLLKSARTYLQRFLVKRWMGESSPRDIIRRIRKRGGPADVAAQQQNVAWADALVFISPIYFMGFPAILKGWIERVFTLGFAFGFGAEGWRGDIGARRPLLQHRKALIISTTIFDRKSYEDGLAEAITKLVDDYCFRYPGIANVQHEYFHAVNGADRATRMVYLDRAEELGRALAGP